MREHRGRRQAGTTLPGVQQPQGPADRLDRIRYMAGQLMPHLPDDEAQELQERLGKVEEIAAYSAMSDEIEAAGHALEAHRAEFEELMSDSATAMDQAFQLFSEERFASMRFTPEDVHRAFEAVGYLSQFPREDREKDMETLIAATQYLVDDVERRFDLARQLLMALPEYVAAGRYLDGWLIQYSAYRMTEVPDEINPFLFAMFVLAFEEWTQRMEEQRESLMRELGLDRAKVAQMDAEEIEALFKAQIADPEKRDWLEAYYEDHPILRDTAQAEVWDLERETVRLLGRDDARRLYLSPEEVIPWVPVLLERLRPVEEQAREAAARGNWAEAGLLDETGRITVEVAREMAPIVFTPQRVDQLKADLRGYGQDLEGRQERKAARLARAAGLLLEREGIAPDENPLLAGICFASLRARMVALGEEARARGDA
jgi:cell fate (sporulation/competence/biofilm development) regulator YlbF (YheA/YmcA/DUF963 family)